MIDKINEEEKNQLKESILYIFIEIINNISVLHYHEYNFEEHIKLAIYESLGGVIEEDIYDNIYEEIIEDIYLENNIIKRSYKNFNNEINENNEEQLTYLKQIPQPQQRTEEWYDFRKKHITGSNCWKIFGSEKTTNQLFYEKLKPDEDSYSKPNLNDNSPFNWGHKYEPLSIKLYEFYNDITVEEFGCLPHKSIPFLAASPDGIVTSKKMNGRMVEIKNVVSREITQIPKMEYYIQMQIQMEVCDLSSCDFVETKFIEYDNEEDFCKDKYKLEKGMIIVLVEDNSKLIFEYSPLFHNKESELNQFTEEVYKKYNFPDNILQHNNIKWFKNIYWKLDTFSNVYVPRNKKWFNEAYIKMKEFWDIVLKEKEIEISYIKYKPKKRSEENETNNKIINLNNKLSDLNNKIIDLNNL